MLVVVIASSTAFAFLHLAPGDPISALGESASVPPALRAQWRAEQGFDQPIGVQYVRWLGHVAQGDFGHSSSQQRPVADVLRERLPNTLLLMGLALAASLVFGSALGAWQGARAGTRADRAISSVALVIYAVPEFGLALLLLFLFDYRLHWLPASGMVDAAMYDSLPSGLQLIDRLRHLALPWASLTLVGTVIFARYQRATMRESLYESFVRTARAKGLRERAVRRHAWRHARLPLVTMAGLFFPALLTGAVFVERVYGWPGMGSALLDAVNKRDYALVSACVIVGSAMTALGSLLADAVRSVMDPRLRTTA